MVLLSSWAAAPSTVIGRGGDPTVKYAPARSSLTDREKEVMHLVSLGFTHAEISRILRISKNTVKQHMTSIYSILGAHNGPHAVRIYLKQALDLDIEV